MSMIIILAFLWTFCILSLISFMISAIVSMAEMNFGSRQTNRARCESILHVPAEPVALREAIAAAASMPRVATALFGDGDSARRFLSIVRREDFWRSSVQKYFVDQVPERRDPAAPADPPSDSREATELSDA